MSVAELLADLAHAPPLPGARCRGEWELFDKTAARRTLPRDQVTHARTVALQLCHDCPALAACNDWVDSLPPWHRPRGVVAGRVNAGALVLMSTARLTPPDSKAPTMPRKPSPQETLSRTLGWQLRELREQHGWRQRDLAELINSGQNRVADWESGEHLPTLPVLQRISAAFNMSVSEFLRDVM